MHYRHLYYFVRIVEAGSFSQAARTIHVAQPALSQQIAELEASLGVPLLQRSARGVKPTAAGQKFYDEASSILRKYENLPGLVRSNSGKVDGRVSLGMPASLSTTLVGSFIEACKADYPSVTPCRWCAISGRLASTCWSGCRRSFWSASAYRSAGAA